MLWFIIAEMKKKLKMKHTGHNIVYQRNLNNLNKDY